MWKCMGDVYAHALDKALARGHRFLVHVQSFSLASKNFLLHLYL